MIQTIATLVTLFIAIMVLWVLYLAVMNLQRARDAGTLTRPAYYLGLPVLYVGLFCDFLVNVTICTLVFVELPREMLVTQRLTRHIRAVGSNWRKSLAAWFCSNLLDAFDPSGCHCKH